MGLFNYVHLDSLYSMLKEFDLNLKSHMNIGNKKTLSFVFCMLLLHSLCFRQDDMHLSKTLISTFLSNKKSNKGVFYLNFSQTILH